mmetsp:Transcript_907/g.1403  ORF Transcript_907/g.1403 Transcript_907/m.1403 type:complete len:766 (-) Transcript_907:89-2386(-)
MGTPKTSKFESKTNHPSYVGCDILLTSEWGQGMAGSSCLSNEDQSKLRQNYGPHQNLNEVGSFDVAEIVSQCRPRYHFAPSSAAIVNKQNSANYDASFFLQSSPYTNPPSALASGVIKNYHTSRFLSLCQVVDSKKAKLGGKSKKFVHALGIQPLWTMDRVTATAVPDNIVVVPSPYTDEKYAKDETYGSNGAINAGNDSGTWKNVGLSEAQTRRILCEENTGSQYRWDIRNRKRPLDAAVETDPTNCTLFLHGLHNDVSKGANLNRGTIFNTFRLHGCTRVRYPGNDSDMGMNGRQHSYCFLEFPSHEEASRCLGKTGGIVEVSGIGLTLKWSSGTNKSKRTDQIPPPPPPNFSGIMMPDDVSHRQKKQRTRLTEEEAIDSSTLFIYLKAKASAPEDYASVILKLGELAQTKLEDAINDGNSGDKVTAEEEPALKVTARSMATKQNCGFLDFASHAAASMALATLTGSTNGGQLITDTDQNSECKDLLQDAELWWSKKSSAQHGIRCENGHNFQKHHFPPDARTDCWFCLASPTCEKHLIVNLAEYCYVTMPKGPVNENHTLIVPINHSSAEGIDDTKKKHIIGAFLDPDPRVVAEIEEMKAKIRMHAQTVLKKDLFVFERAIPTKGGYHAHVNCIPIERGLGQKLRSTMVSMAATKSKNYNGFELREIQNPDINTTTILRNDDDLDGYFYAEIFEGNDTKRFLYKLNAEDKLTKMVPVEFGRTVLASVMKAPNLASWKGCVLSKETEEEYTAKYRQSYEDFDK